MTVKVIGSEVNSMFGSIAERYDLANSVLSLGIHKLWRRRLLSLVSEGTVAALDLCTGTGDLLPILRKRCQFVQGADFCLPMMRAGQKKRRTEDRFLQADALSLPFANSSFDLITVAFGVRNLENIRQGLAEMHRVLKPGGKLIVLEFGQPSLPVFGALYRWYSAHLLPLIGGVLTGNKSAYTYLPETSKVFPCGQAFAQLLSDVGFSVKLAEAQTFGVAFLYEAQR
jgi:demethylmenaquinone methyltransferase/2-methoxy-6-polyprenyl-1,4-benzoquinol methylase